MVRLSVETRALTTTRLLGVVLLLLLGEGEGLMDRQGINNIEGRAMPSRLAVGLVFGAA